MEAVVVMLATKANMRTIWVVSGPGEFEIPIRWSNLDREQSGSGGVGASSTSDSPSGSGRVGTSSTSSSASTGVVDAGHYYVSVIGPFVVAVPKVHFYNLQFLEEKASIPDGIFVSTGVWKTVLTKPAKGTPPIEELTFAVMFREHGMVMQTSVFGAALQCAEICKTHDVHVVLGCVGTMLGSLPMAVRAAYGRYHVKAQQIWQSAKEFSDVTIWAIGGCDRLTGPCAAQLSLGVFGNLSLPAFYAEPRLPAIRSTATSALKYPIVYIGQQQAGCGDKRANSQVEKRLKRVEQGRPVGPDKQPKTFSAQQSL